MPAGRAETQFAVTIQINLLLLVIAENCFVSVWVGEGFLIGVNEGRVKHLRTESCTEIAFQFMPKLIGA